MLVWVASYPRSGNTLTMLTLRDVFGVERLGVFHEHLRFDWLPKHLLPPNPERKPYPPSGFRHLTNAELVATIREGPEPFFIKTHRPGDASDRAPALYIVRDGRDALVSQAHRVQQVGVPEFRGLRFNRTLAALMRSGRRSYGDWSRHVRLWRGRSAPTAIIRFEELVERPGEVVAAGCRQLGLSMPKPTGMLTPFASARKHNPVEFRRGVVGSWQQEMPARLEERFWAIHGEEMMALGYPRR